MYVCVAENAELLGFFYFFLHLSHRQFSFIDLCLSSKMYWTFNCSWDNVMKWNVFFFCVLHIFQNFPCTLGEKSKSVSFSRVYVCVKAKLTLVSFFLLFFLCTFPLATFPVIFLGKSVKSIEGAFFSPFGSYRVKISLIYRVSQKNALSECCWSHSALAQHK